LTRESILKAYKYMDLDGKKENDDDSS